MPKFGISYNVSADNDVKVHSGECRHTKRADNEGSVKWVFAESLESAVKEANAKCKGNNLWRYAKCCLHEKEYLYKCIKCDGLTYGKRLSNKFVTGALLFMSFITGYLPIVHEEALLLGVPVLYEILATFAFTAIFIVAAIIYYVLLPKRCHNCRVENYK